MAIDSRYMKLSVPIPNVVRSAMSLHDVMERNELMHELMHQGPLATSSLENAKEFLRRYCRGPLDAAEVGNLLIYTVLTPDAEQYQPDILVTAIRDLFPGRIQWQDVIVQFDREGLVVSQAQVLSIYNALLVIAQNDPDFDIQLLWGGKWRNKATQLSFAASFASLSSSQLNATTIPRLRLAYDPREWEDVPAEYAAFADEAVQDPMISSEAVAAIIEGLWDSSHSLDQDIAYAKQIVGEKMTLFLSSAGGISKPWVASHHQLMVKTVLGCLGRSQKDYQWLLHCMWKQDRAWIAHRLMDIHIDEPLQLPILLEHATEHGWLEELCRLVTGFGIDLAALAHRKGLIDFRPWAQEKLERNASEFTNSLHRFLIIKAQDETRTMRNEQPAPRTVSLAMKTVYATLEILEENMKDQGEQLRGLERQCMQAFPRLCNYGESDAIDAIIEANGQDGNNLPETADAEMQDLYKRMYGGELEVRHVIERLKECKSSQQADRQELFACMIHGLFDEFICFHEYPLGPLATTAVLFGGIISYRLIGNFALNVALDMVLESVRDFPPESSMYKFGLQASLHFVPRLPEWPDFCQQIVQIPTLQGSQVYGPAQDALREQRNAGPETNGFDPNPNGQKDMNGNADGSVSHDPLVPQFRSVNVDPATFPERFEDPEEEVQDKVLFVLNNVSEQNLSAKIHDLVDSLEPRHFQWFASYIVEQRAKSQPNYQQLYLDLLGMLDDRNLWADVLRETYVSVRKVLNAESTMKNSVDRAHLKNLATWLGSLTLARDKPIKHKNIAFKELLIEGFETQRQILTIPFTCEVLAQGFKSTIFKPPNPWVEEIISVLMEMYDLPDLKIQQKFAVEVLLNVFNLPRNGEGLKRSNELVKRRLHFESELAEPPMSDGLEGFDDLSIGNLNRGVRNPRFSPTAIASSLPDLSEMLVFPPSSGPNQARLRQVVLMAVQRSILEIITPVVERSVTIATIATKDLVTKDYAMEGDEERLREALENVAKTTSASLASVTCKEPLRMSITNHIRNAALEMPDQAFPEGLVLMSVNDNIDIACKIVEKQAEEKAIPEIKAHIESEVAKRREHKALSNEPYRDPAFSQWSTYIGEPYKLTPGGLNQQQLDIYDNFAPQARGINHQPNQSTDSGKQIPDVLQEAGFPSVPNLSTPAEPPALPHQPQPQQPHGNLPLALSEIRSPAQVNGYTDPAALEDQAYQMLTEIARLAKEASEQRFKDISRDGPIVDLFSRLLNVLRQAQDVENLALQIASATTTALYNSAESRFEVEMFAQILLKMCQVSQQTFLTLSATLRKQMEARVLKAGVTAALLEVGLMEFPQVDLAIRRGIETHSIEVLHAFGELLDIVLFSKEPVALRGDFATSFQAMSEWLSMAPELDEAQIIVQKMKSAGIPESIEPMPDQASRIAQEQMNYIFLEWISLYGHTHSTENILVAFINSLFHDKVLKNQEDLVLFFRLAVDTAIDSYEHNIELSLKQPSVDFSVREAHFQIDALARFIILLVKNQAELNPTSMDQSKAQYMASLLSLLVFILNNHHSVRGDRFNQKSWFRLFSSILYDWHEVARNTIIGRENGARQDEEMILAFGNTILLLEPQHFPAFAHAWLDLASHRVFMPAILSTAGHKGPEIFVKVIQDMLSYVCGLQQPNSGNAAALNLYRGVLRILLVLHHDFPEFLAQNHYHLCSVIPPQCTQLCNLVLSAFPSSMFELPDPFSSGLKVDRLEEIKSAPEMDGDFMQPLQQVKLSDAIEGVFESGDFSDEVITQIVEALYSVHQDLSLELQSSVLQSLVLCIGHSAIVAASSRNGLTFSPDSVDAALFTKLTRELRPEIRYYLLSAIANQLRYPNAHTHYFSHALLHLFGSDQTDAQGTDVRQQITRVLLERIVVHRPHPWGLIITLLELLKNPSYMFWELPFTKAVPEVSRITVSINSLAAANNSLVDRNSFQHSLQGQP